MFKRDDRFYLKNIMELYLEVKEKKTLRGFQ